MQTIFNVINAVYNFIVGFPQWIIDQIVKVITSFLLMLKDLVCWVLEQFLSLVTSAIGQFDMSGISEHLGAFGAVPAEMVNILGLVGAGECLGIIAAALIIRMVLQLIPFVRLGS